MGCTLSNPFSLSPEENLIQQTLSTLSFNNYSSLTLIEAFHPALSIHQISYKVLKKILIFLNATQSTYSFLKDLTGAQPCSSKKLKTLLILLSNSEVANKVLHLFTVFAEDNLNKLLKSEAEIMVSQILQINLQYIPSYVLKLYENYPKSEELQGYCMKLSLFNNSLLKLFIKKMFRRETELDSVEFVARVMGNEKLKILFQGAKLRDFCVNLFIKNLTATAIASSGVYHEAAHTDDKLTIT